MIIIEGLDATGKSVLAYHISRLTGWAVQRSEGPEKYPGEITKRIERYLAMSDNTIFDRHPLISQFIYGALSNKTLPPQYLLQELKRRDPYIIQSHPDNRGEHILKQYDTPEHLKLIKRRQELKHLYEKFFSIHFPLRYTYTFQTAEIAAKAAAAYAKRREHETALND